MNTSGNGFENESVLPTRLEQEAYGWVVRFVSGEATQKDIEALKEWSALSPDHVAAFDNASKVWRATAPITRRMALGGSLGNGILGERIARPRLGRRAIMGGSLAAAAAAVAMVADPPLGLWPSWSELTAGYRTAAGEQRRITLADNASIDMNTRTSIALRPAAGGTDRIDLIAGEAMVSTPPETPSAVTVVAANGRIVAVDARFNVLFDDGSVCVTCMQGQVQVEYGPAALPLPAGRQVIYSVQGLGQVISADIATVSAWQSGTVIFDALPIARVVAEVNRYRPGRIILTNAALGREQFSARFQIKDINEVVGQIERVFGARATLLPGGIVLLG